MFQHEVKREQPNTTSRLVQGFTLFSLAILPLLFTSLSSDPVPKHGEEKGLSFWDEKQIIWNDCSPLLHDLNLEKGTDYAQWQSCLTPQRVRFAGSHDVFENGRKSLRERPLDRESG